MIKDFTPLGLRLLGPTSNGLGLSIMLKSVKKCVYNTQMLLKPTPMNPEYSKMVPQPLSSSHLVKNCLSYDFCQYFHNFLLQISLTAN